MTARQHIARFLAFALFVPVAIPVSIVTPTPGPDWLHTYGRVFEKIAGKEGFTWSSRS